jgi:hypothetical protein
MQSYPLDLRSMASHRPSPPTIRSHFDAPDLMRRRVTRCFNHSRLGQTNGLRSSSPANQAGAPPPWPRDGEERPCHPSASPELHHQIKQSYTKLVGWWEGWGRLLGRRQRRHPSLEAFAAVVGPTEIKRAGTPFAPYNIRRTLQH